MDTPLSHVRVGRPAGSRVLDLEGVIGEVMRSGRAFGDLPVLYAGGREGTGSGSRLAGLRIIRVAPGVDVFVEPEDMDGRCE